MKKVIAVLAVLAIVAGFAFADDPQVVSETHKIKIKADVTVVPPVFQLIHDKTGTITNKTTEFTKDATYYEDGGADVDFNLEKGGTATFTVKLANAAKQIQGYTLTFSGGEFTNIKTGGQSAANIVPTITATAGTKFTGTSSIEKTKDAEITVTFNGKTAATGSTIATCKYVYTGVPDIDLGTYYADVVMTVKIV